MDWCAVQGESLALIRLAPQNLGISRDARLPAIAGILAFPDFEKKNPVL